MLNDLINKENYKHKPKLGLRFIDELTAASEESGCLRILSVSDSENILISVEIINSIDNVFALESILFDMFIDAVGVYTRQSTEMRRYSNMIRIEFISDFQGEGLIKGAIEVSGEMYEEISKKYETDYGALEFYPS